MTIDDQEDETGAYGGSLLVNSHTFMGADYVEIEDADLDDIDANVGILGFPYDGGSILRSGQNVAPNTIRNATDQFVFWHYDHDFDLNEEYEFIDFGDISVHLGQNKRTQETAQAVHKSLLEANILPVMLGGDHSISIAGLRSVGDHYENPGFILFDSHLDTAPHVDNEPYNHACPVPRAIDEGGFAPENISLIGMNGMLNAKDELTYAENQGINVFPLDEVIQEGPIEVAKKAVEAASEGTDATYLSFDQDVLDAAHSPATTAPTPCGMTSRELVQMLNVVGSNGIEAMDVVETSPGWAHSRQSSVMAVRVILEVLAANATGEVNAPGTGNNAKRLGPR